MLAQFPCQSARGWTRERLQGKLMLAQAPARALADEHARGSKAHFFWHSSRVRALADAHARGSRANSCWHRPPARALADKHARGSKAHFCWHSSPVRALADEHARGSKGSFRWHSSSTKSARGRTRERLKDKLCWHRFPAQALAKGHARCSRPREHCPRRPSRRRDGSSLHDPFCDGLLKSETSTTSSTSPRRLELSCLRKEIPTPKSEFKNWSRR